MYFLYKLKHSLFYSASILLEISFHHSYLVNLELINDPLYTRVDVYWDAS